MMSSISCKPCKGPERMTEEELEAYLHKKKHDSLVEVRSEVGDGVATDADAAKAVKTTEDDQERCTLAELLKRDPSLSLEQHAMMIFCSFARGVHSCGGSFQSFLNDLPNLKKLLIAYGALDDSTQNRFDRYLYSDNWWKKASTTDPAKLFHKKDLEPVEKVLAFYTREQSRCSSAGDEDDVQSDGGGSRTHADQDQSSSGQEVLVPCRDCRVLSCSNCLTPFKNGDFMTTEIPSIDFTNSRGEKCVSIEIALINIFEPHNPYPRWIKAKEKATSLTSRLLDMLEKAFMKDLEKEDVIDIEAMLSTEQRRLLEKKLWELCEKVTKYVVEQGDLNPCLEMVYEKLGGIQTKKGPKEDESYVTPTEAKAYFVVKLKELKEEKEQESGCDQLSSKVVGGHSKFDDDVGLPDFQLCEGCGEILTVLFSAWENYRNGRISEDAYYYQVMYGFKMAKNGQDVIFRPPPESKMNIFKKYSKECHPIGCLVRSTSTSKHVKMNLGQKKKDLMKNAVGNLHAYMEEAYRRVFNEIISQIDVASDESECGDDGPNYEDVESRSVSPDSEDEVIVVDDFEEKLKIGDGNEAADEDVKDIF